MFILMLSTFSISYEHPSDIKLLSEQWRDMWKNVFIKLDETDHLSTDSIFKIWLRYETQGKMDID
eukprot:UN15586